MPSGLEQQPNLDFKQPTPGAGESIPTSGGPSSGSIIPAPSVFEQQINLNNKRPTQGTVDSTKNLQQPTIPIGVQLPGFQSPTVEQQQKVKPQNLEQPAQNNQQQSPPRHRPNRKIFDTNRGLAFLTNGDDDSFAVDDFLA